MNRFRAVLLIAAIPLVASASAPAQDPPQPPSAPLSARAGIAERGWIRLAISGPQGSTVRVLETTGHLSVPVTTLTLPQPASVGRRVAAWRCDRLTREFTVSAALPDGSAQQTVTAVSTPSCKRRFELVSTRGRAGRGLDVLVRDRFLVGDVSAQVCAAPGARRLRCRTVRFARGQKTRPAHFRASHPGRYRIRLQSRFGQRSDSSAVVRPRGGRFTLLATGDSMIQYIDTQLAARLTPKGARVRSDAHISTGISKLGSFNWLAHARGSARSVKPDVTVMFLGANDGFPIPGKGGGSAGCCGTPWVNAYAQRARTMMRSYLRRGSGRVYWLLLPAPRPQNFATVFRGVNAAVSKAASGFDTSEVKILDLRRTFTPGGRFRQSIRYGGSDVSVRQGDGVHLNMKGASIAAGLIVRALRSDGYVR